MLNKQRSLLVLLVMLSLLSLYLWREMSSLRSELLRSAEAKAILEKELISQEQQLTSQHAALKSQLESALSRLEERTTFSPQPPKIALSQRFPNDQSPQPQAPEDRRTLWRARQAVSEVEEMMAISDAEKTALSDLLQREYRSAADGLSPQERERVKQDALEQVLGGERARQLMELQKARQQRELEESINRDVIVLSRRLGLSQEQEQDVRQAIEQAEQLVLPKREAVREKMQEAMALHLEGESGKDKLQTQYDEIKTLSDELKLTKDRAIVNSLEGKLSDRQKNELLALQAQEP